MTDDERWPEPAGVGAAHRVMVRVAATLLVALCFAAVFGPYLQASTPHLWPPMDPLGRWAGFVGLHVFGFVLLPMVVGSALGDLLFDRYVK